MDALPNFGLANTMTGFCTLMAGVTAVWLSQRLRRQPDHWMLVYWLIAVTGIFTITLHGFGETAGGPGPRWMWAFLDTGSNIVVTWAIARAALVDYYSSSTNRRFQPVLAGLLGIGLILHFLAKFPASELGYALDFGAWGGFNFGEAWLVGFSLTTTALFYAKRAAIPPGALPLLHSVVVAFLIGLALATASNDQILPPFLALHALWHVVSAFGLVFLWAFNHARLELTARAT